MPSKKTISVSIVCLGIIVSVWLFAKQPTEQGLVAKSENKGEVVPAIQIKEKTNDDWKKILTSIDQKNQKILDLTSKNKVNPQDDTTLTDQMSRDFLSQYLIAVKNGVDVTPEVAGQIAQKTLSLPEYKQSSVVYIIQNLKIVKKSDPVTVGKYKDKIKR